ncbi:MAG: hypothetical protein WCP28_17585 [Actinomycetes bacterium]
MLIEIDAPVNKDTVLHPLVRWQYCGGTSEEDRKGFLFTNMVDGKGHKYDVDVAVGVVAGIRMSTAWGWACRSTRSEPIG